MRAGDFLGEKNMSDASTKDQKPNVIMAAMTLAERLHEDPLGVDKSVYDQGNEVIAFYNDGSFSGSFKNIKNVKQEIVMQAIEDLSTKVKILSNSYIGVVYKDNRLRSFSCHYGEEPDGRVIYKISLKNQQKFEDWRNGQGPEVPAMDINCAIYRLCVEWARLMG